MLTDLRDAVRTRRPVTYAGVFAAGLNTDAQPYLLKEGECRACSNVNTTSRGAIRKRDGVQTHATVGAALTSLYASANPNFLLGAGGTVLYSISPAGVVTTIKTGMTNGARWEWVNAPASGGQGPLFGVNGSEIQQWDGVAAATSAWTAASGTLPAGAKYLVYAGNRVFAAGMTSYAGVADPSSALVFTDLAKPRDWPAVNVVQFDPNDGEPITGIGVVGPYVLVFKPSKAWAVYDLDTGANRRLGENIGCNAHRSIVETPGGTLFLGADGIYLTDGSNARRISDRIAPTLRAIVPASRQLAAGAFYDGHYYLAVTSSGATNNLLVDYDTVTDSFWLHTLAEAQLAVWDGDGSRRLYGAKGTQIDRCFVAGETTDNGTAFPASWSSPFYTFGQTSFRKRIWAIHFDGQGRIQASIAKDFATANVLWQDSSFTALGDGLYQVDDGSIYQADDGTVYMGAASIGQARVLTPGIARAWSVTYGNTTAEPFEVESMTFELAHKARR